MKFTAFSLLVACLPQVALAHASNQGFVLLLPTGVYTIAGVLAVGLTVVLVALLPDYKQRHFVPRFIALPQSARSRHGVSLLSTTLVFMMIFEGLTGSADPTVNLMPLGFWVVFWIGFVLLHGVFGNLWPALNPWRGLYHLLARHIKPRGRLPANTGYSLALLQLLGFAGFLLVDPAPADPRRLAWITLLYWLFTLSGTVLFGPRWLKRAEFLGVFLSQFALLSPFKWTATGLHFSWPGWQITARPLRVPTLAVIPLVMLASGSFDGLNETFWWLGKIGVNPLMYPGRTAVMLPTALGLIGAISLLLAGFALALFLGQVLARDTAKFSRSFTLFAPTVLPIALGYHFAHYLPGFLVDAQYVALAMVQRFGVEPFYVTTGFFFVAGPVRLIWLTQAGAVVLGHVMAIILAHLIALGELGSARRAMLAQFPLGLFMIAYTFFGLWLLAAPRGG